MGSPSRLRRNNSPGTGRLLSHKKVLEASCKFANCVLKKLFYHLRHDGLLWSVDSFFRHLGSSLKSTAISATLPNVTHLSYTSRSCLPVSRAFLPRLRTILHSVFVFVLSKWCFLPRNYRQHTGLSAAFCLIFFFGASDCILQHALLVLVEM